VALPGSNTATFWGSDSASLPGLMRLQPELRGQVPSARAFLHRSQAPAAFTISIRKFIKPELCHFTPYAMTATQWERQSLCVILL